MLPILAAAFVLFAPFAQQEPSSVGVRATTRADGTAVVTGEHDVGRAMMIGLGANGGSLLVSRSTMEIARLSGAERDAAVQRGQLAGVVFVSEPADSLAVTNDPLVLSSRSESTIPIHQVGPKDSYDAPKAWALTPAYSQDLDDAAVFFIEGELFPAHVMAGSGTTPWQPGTFPGESVEGLRKFLNTAQSTSIERKAFESAKKRVWDGTSLGVSALSRSELAAALTTFKWTPDAIGARVAALDYETFLERRAVHFDVARTRFCTFGPEVPEGAIDVSKTAWERSEPAAVERAEKLLAAVGGVEAWSALDSVRLEVETATRTQLDTHTARSTTLRCLTRPLTLIDQDVKAGEVAMKIRTGFVGNEMWLERGSLEAGSPPTMLELPRAQIERAIHGERRALPRVLRMLATREKVGVKNGADGSLELFDDGGPFCRLELDADSRVRALVDDEGPTTRRLEFERWEEFAGVWLPTRHREIGERTVEVTLLAFEKVEPLAYSRFLSPLMR
jgi:hypothetical protein